MILKNHGVPGRNWVRGKSNRMAIGARIKVVAGGMAQTDEVHSGGSYLSQNDTRLHLGLGSAKKRSIMLRSAGLLELSRR